MEQIREKIGLLDQEICKIYKLQVNGRQLPIIKSATNSHNLQKVSAKFDGT